MVFPIEMLELILQELEQGHLPCVLRANSTLHNVGVRVLYRSIPHLPVARSIACLKVLSSNTTLATLVRELRIGWSDSRVTGNLLRLLRGALQQLRNLRSLFVELSPHDNHFSHAWVFDDAPYKLRAFATSTRCDSTLARLLEQQPLIRELQLRGFQTNLPFVLSPPALPRLESFRCTHAGAAAMAEVLRGRPVESLSISLFADEGFDPLDTLRLPSVPLKRLTLMALDELPATKLLHEVSARVTELEALHIVVLLSHYSYESLLEAGPALSNFKNLRYLTVMSGLGSTVSDDPEIAKEWHKHCPTLKTIILPEGQVWFEREGAWSCCL
ncbi:hypothetical protein DAEQUDRAFT_676377 [Daedalea quercina L-15889]|uniref:F-box domain-containing protein n=1 Tax=Daedalea quercina L-15889 TaxID=1314783 RepID=A0A165MGW2_9APHY|nr:hypothetical protein DAEQUDRAFT_676377 [Daedalea quercina L-15889]